MVKGGQAKSSGNRSRIAILPFANISADPRDSYFADGMTEELISTMSKLNEMSVISRTSVMQYKKKTKTIKEIGRELNAGTVLEGSVRKSGTRFELLSKRSTSSKTRIYGPRVTTEISETSSPSRATLLNKWRKP